MVICFCVSLSEERSRRPGVMSEVDEGDDNVFEEDGSGIDADNNNSGNGTEVRSSPACFIV